MRAYSSTRSRLLTTQTSLAKAKAEGRTKAVEVLQHLLDLLKAREATEPQPEPTQAPGGWIAPSDIPEDGWETL